ncbi:MAG TPA: DUF4870 domain-containing protein [Candidatus Solibacter sp.]|nr:DUF4870 domain-containing protein [Candidatus Solibacter sp.]
MAFCKACGQETGDATFCPKCGAPQGSAPGGAVAAPTAAAPATAGMEENVAGLLCYLVGWITGLIFLLIDKRPFVKFHGAQSIALNIAFFVVWVAFWVVTMVLGMITAMLHFPIGFLMAFLFPVVILAFFITFIFCMYKAYNHEMFKLPIIGNIVEKMVNK